ncbi:MAG: dTMP kinase [Holosporaceae bacterium]|nr:dTMP kinase [Holosporaceae bacterium]
MNGVGGGKFITFEGGEGVGKSTQTRLLAQKLSDLNQKVQVTREPGGGEVGERIRKILKQSTGMDSLSEVLLIFAARRDHFVRLIQPWMKEGYFVICDRFYDSSLVYQGLLRGVPIADIMELKRMTVGDFEPDLTMILDLDVSASISRTKIRSSENDDYDKMDLQSHNTIRQGFRQTADIFSFRSVLINAEGSEKTVFYRVWKTFKKSLNVN